MLTKSIQETDVPALGLGTWQLRGETCTDAVEHALSIGYRHIDTAQAYENEEAVGRGLKASSVARDDVFLTTKVWYENLAPSAIERAASASLKKLQTDYVDLLLIHWPSDAVPVEQSIEAMQRLRDRGMVRNIGVSNFTADLLDEALDLAPNLFCNQVEYHPYLSQASVLERAQEHDLLVTAYSPIARGKVTKDETLKAIGAAHGRSPVQVALRWLIQQDQVAAIPKAATPSHRESNLAITDFTLTEDEMERIHDLARDERLIDPSFAPAW